MVILNLKSKKNKKFKMTNNILSNRQTAKKNLKIWIMRLGKERMELVRIKRYSLSREAMLNSEELSRIKVGMKTMMFGLLTSISNGQPKYSILIT